MTWFQSEISCFEDVRQWGHEEQWGHDQGFLCALHSVQSGRDCLCFVEKEKMTWFQSEIDCVRQWGHEEQWGHDQGLLCALPPLQVGSVVSV